MISRTLLTIETSMNARPPVAIRCANRTSSGLRPCRNSARWNATGEMIIAVANAAEISATT